MPKRKSTNQLTKQVGIARAERARKGDSSNKSDSSQKDVQSNVADTVSLDKLADVMIDKMTQRGLIFASSPAVSQSSVSGTVVQEDSLPAATSNAPGSGQDILCGNTTTVMHHASSQVSSQDNNIQTVLSQPVAAAHSSSDKEVEQLLNGMPINTNALPLNQSFFYGLSLSALVPDKIKSQIWDKKFLEMSQLYQIQTRGEIKQDVSVNISNQGSSTLVKVQPKQTQGHDLSISQWLTAFNCYMDVYVQKFPNETSSLLAYMNLIRDLEHRRSIIMIVHLGLIGNRRISHGVKCILRYGTNPFFCLYRISHLRLLAGIMRLPISGEVIGNFVFSLIVAKVVFDVNAGLLIYAISVIRSTHAAIAML